MSVKKIRVGEHLFHALRTGAAALLFTILLLFPAAVLIRMGILPAGGERLTVSCTAFLGALIASIALRKGRECGILEALLSGCAALFLLLVLCAAIPRSQLHLVCLLPETASILAGATLGSIMQINKKYRKHGRKR